MLVKYLSTTLLQKASKIARDYARELRPRREGSVAPKTNSAAGLDGFAAEITDPRERAEAREMREVLRTCLDTLGPLDREILVLRGIEQMPNRRVAEKLGQQPATVSMRYRRALGRLRVALPDSVFAELPDEER